MTSAGTSMNKKFEIWNFYFFVHASILLDHLGYKLNLIFELKFIKLYYVKSVIDTEEMRSIQLRQYNILSSMCILFKIINLSLQESLLKRFCITTQADYTNKSTLYYSKVTNLTITLIGLTYFKSITDNDLIIRPEYEIRIWKNISKDMIIFLF